MMQGSEHTCHTKYYHSLICGHFTNTGDMVKGIYWPIVSCIKMALPNNMWPQVASSFKFHWCWESYDCLSVSGVTSEIWVNGSHAIMWYTRAWDILDIITANTVYIAARWGTAMVINHQTLFHIKQILDVSVMSRAVIDLSHILTTFCPLYSDPSSKSSHKNT